MILLIQKIQSLNLFERNGHDDNESTIYQQILSTRIYLILESVLRIIFILYIGVGFQKQTITILSPTLEQYESLFTEHALNNLICPCTRLSVRYDEFLAIEAIMHSICSSSLLKQSWLLEVGAWVERERSYILADFRSGAPSYFRIIDNFCSLSRRTIDDALIVFGTNHFVNARLLSRSQFIEQARSIATDFVTSTSDQFRQIIRIIRDTTQGNQLLTAYGTNAIIRRMNLLGFTYTYHVPTGYFHHNASRNFKCYCKQSAACSDQQGFWDLTNLIITGYTKITPIEGLLIACSPLESAFLSSLECWFNQGCLDNVTREFGIPSLVAITRPRRFSVTDTFGTIVEHLIVDDWYNQSSYENFYRACSPDFCTYTVTERNNIVYVLTTMIGFFGGISVALKLIVPHSITMGAYAIGRIRNRHSSSTEEALGNFNFFLSNRFCVSEPIDRFNDFTCDSSRDYTPFHDGLSSIRSIMSTTRFL